MHPYANDGEPDRQRARRLYICANWPRHAPVAAALLPSPAQSTLLALHHPALPVSRTRWKAIVGEAVHRDRYAKRH
jgi:hypothetical protein